MFATGTPRGIERRGKLNLWTKPSTSVYSEAELCSALIESPRLVFLHPRVLVAFLLSSYFMSCVSVLPSSTVNGSDAGV